MNYAGKYKLFEPSRIRTYPVSERTNKVKLNDLLDPARALRGTYDVADQADAIAELGEAIVDARRRGRAVIYLTGAHSIKNGLGPILIDLVRRGIVSLVASNGAGIIHDFELALIGETSENVPNALPKGQFGMADELSYINAALAEADARKLGYGEGIGRMICDEEFRSAVAARLGRLEPIVFQHSDISVTAACYRHDIPLTIHVGIGTDVTDQHGNFDGAAKGGCSARDFLMFTHAVSGLADGGVYLNIGCAVTGPEVLLKAVSMAGNVGETLTGLITADFDLRAYHPQAMTDETDMHYYFRDHKSVATRIPEAFGGKGFYIQGDQQQTLPRLYQEIIKRL